MSIAPLAPFSPGRPPDAPIAPELSGAKCDPAPVRSTSLGWPCADEAVLCGPSSPPPRFGGAQWVTNTRFRNDSGSEVVSLILAHIRAQATLAARGEGKPPVVVADLDYTLYNNDPRMLAVLVAWANSPAARGFPTQRRAILRGLEARYDIADTLRTGGLSDAHIKAAMPSILAYFREAFFDDAHALMDTAYPWMCALLRAFQDAGAVLVFLTGRDAERQGLGTRWALARDGFPVDDERVFLMLKPAAPDGARITDQEFKAQAAKPIAAMGDVVATLDNEPANALVFSTLYPHAANVFVDTRYSDGLVPVGDGLMRIGEQDVADALLTPRRRMRRRRGARSTLAAVWGAQLSSRTPRRRSR